LVRYCNLSLNDLAEQGAGNGNELYYRLD